jgi:hypothetical protein
VEKDEEKEQGKRGLRFEGRRPEIRTAIPPRDFLAVFPLLSLARGRARP